MIIISIAYLLIHHPALFTNALIPPCWPLPCTLRALPISLRRTRHPTFRQARHSYKLPARPGGRKGRIPKHVDGVSTIGLRRLARRRGRDALLETRSMARDRGEQGAFTIFADKSICRPAERPWWRFSSIVAGKMDILSHGAGAPFLDMVAACV